MDQRISVHVCTKDRHSEIACLLVSLRNQTYTKWDLVIVDESGTPLTTHVPTMHLLNRIRQERHKVNYMRNNMLKGVCNARNICIDNDHFKNSLILRVDDDVVLEPDYIEKLYNVLVQGYDLASGVTPLMAQPEIVRDSQRIKHGIVNRIDWSPDGDILDYKDDCGMCYEDRSNITSLQTPNVFNADHFRSCALYKSKVHDDNDIRYETNLSPVGFREESFFSLRMRWMGYKLGVDLTAKAWHFQTPSGGCRYPNYKQLVVQDDESFKKWAKRMYKEKGELK